MSRFGGNTRVAGPRTIAATRRISQAEAAGDPQLVFVTADKNGDGYLDSSEYSQREMSNESVPNSSDPSSDTEKPRP